MKSEPTSDDWGSGKAAPGVAQVGNRKIPWPKKVSDRAVQDDIDD